MTFETYLRGKDTPEQWSIIFGRLLLNYHRENPETLETDEEHIEHFLWGLYYAGGCWRLNGKFVLPPLENPRFYLFQLQLARKAGGPSTYAERL